MNIDSIFIIVESIIIVAFNGNPKKIPMEKENHTYPL